MTAIAASIEIISLALANIEPDPAQARDEGADDELAASIASVGVLQPIRVYELDAGGFMIEDGERRYRGSLKAGNTHIPAVIVPAPESVGDKLLLQVTANDGKRLKPMEEARTFKRIMEAKGWNIQQLADHLGRSKSTVSDRLAIVDVPAAFARFFEEGILSAAAAPILRPLAGLPDKAQKRVVDAILDDYNWDDAVSEARANKKAIPVTGKWGSVESLVEETLGVELRVINPQQGADYKGKTVTVGKTAYAVDVAAYDAALKKAETAAPGAKKPTISDAQRKTNADEKARRLREKEAREKADAKRALEGQLREAQFAIVATKIPDVIDGAWALALVQHLTRDMAYEITPAALRAMGVTPPKKAEEGKGVGHVAEKLLLDRAANLPVKGRTRLLLQLLAFDPHPWGKEDRLADAARLTKVDLKKVKVPEPVFAGAPPVASKKAR